MSLKLVDDHRCFVCGKENAHGFRLDFEHPDKGVLRTSVVFSNTYQGFKNIVHGGVMATILDEVMVNAAWKEGIPAVTAGLNIRLKKPGRIGERIFFEGKLEPSAAKKRVFKAHATAKNEKGQLLATATATCVQIKKKVD